MIAPYVRNMFVCVCVAYIYIYEKYNEAPNKSIVTDVLYNTFLSSITMEYPRQNSVPNHVNIIITLLCTICLVSA